MIIAVDFDGTICTHKYPLCGDPRMDVIKALLRCKKYGHTLILWTCRTGEQLQDAIDYCKEYGLEFDYINDNTDKIRELFNNDPDSRKIVADLYLDDKAISPEVFVELA